MNTVKQLIQEVFPVAPPEVHVIVLKDDVDRAKIVSHAGRAISPDFSCFEAGKSCLYHFCNSIQEIVLVLQMHGMEPCNLPSWMGGEYSFESWRKNRFTLERRRILTSEEKLLVSRAQNNAASKRKREKKKAEVSGLTAQVNELERERVRLKSEHHELLKLLSSAHDEILEHEKILEHAMG